MQATTRDYDLACPDCRYNLRGIPPLPDDCRVRCPECGCISVDFPLKWRMASAAGLCGECGRNLKGLPRLSGSGVLLCPRCGHPYVQLTGVYLNRRICDREVACLNCRKDLRGTEFQPHSQITTCPECGGRNSSTPIPPLPEWPRHRSLPGHCRCGYDLTGNESGRCPECGVEVQA